MSTATQKTRSGFTLMELLVAVALAIILMSVVVLVFSQALGVFRRAHATTEAIHSAQVGLDFLGKDLDGAYLETEQVFLGVRVDTDLGGCGVDNDREGGANEDLVDGLDNDGDTKIDEDPLDFDNTAGMERHGLELVSMSLFSFDSAGQPVPAVHVLYYVAWDPTTQRGRLIRCTQERDVNPVTPFMGDSLAGLVDLEETQEIAYGVKQFRLRYFHEGVWYDGWDSTNPDGYDTDPLATQDDVQYTKLPQVVEVQLTLVDSEGFMDRVDSNPIVIRRLIPVGTVVP